MEEEKKRGTRCQVESPIPRIPVYFRYNRIVEVCGWSLENININQNRRVTVSLLRKLLDAEKSHVKIESGQNEQKEQGFYMLVEK